MFCKHMLMQFTSLWQSSLQTQYVHEENKQHKMLILLVAMDFVQVTFFIHQYCSNYI
jgi:hypothetical protein